MIFFGLIIALAMLFVFLRVSLRFWDRHDLEESSFNRRLFVIWFVKGIVVPLFVWMMVNVGISERFPPILASIEVAKSAPGGHWLGAWLGLVPPALLILGSYWMGATFIWLVAAHVVELECDRGDLIASMGVWGALLSPILLLLVYLGHLASVGIVVTIWLIPVMSELLALGNPRKRLIHPTYAKALGKIKIGDFKIAEREVIRQLSKRDSDFEGWMMLAELYAKQFNDLPEADRLVRELCRQPELNKEQMCEALHRLADWHLNIGNNPRAARNALEEICAAYPATHAGDVARQRINKLQPTSR